jgi:nucleotide-binding universal stress UspA family protein
MHVTRSFDLVIEKKEAVMYRSILVAVDGSQAATRALEEAVALARRDHGRLTLIGVVPRLRRFGWPLFVPYPSDAELARETREVVERAEALVPPDIPVSTVVRMGPVAKAILHRAAQGEHDLIVVGSRGLAPVASALLGGVSAAVVARSAVPVLVVPAQASSVRPREAAEARAA